MKSIQHAVEYAAFVFVRAVVGLLPLSWVRRMGASCGRMIGATLGFRWRVAVDNVRMAFPDLPERDCAEMAERSFTSVGTTVFELLSFDRMTPESLARQIIADGDQHFRSAAEAGRGVIALGAHYGSWEIVPQALATALGVPATVLVRGLANPLIDRAVDRLRRTFGAMTVPSTIAVRELFRTLQRGGTVYMAADQSAPPESVQVPFFGRITPAFEGPAVLALRTGARIVLTIARRIDDGRYRVTFEPIAFQDLSSDAPDSVRRLTERCMEATERAIRRDPSQWMWMHRRWKHTPLQP